MRDVRVVGEQGREDARLREALAREQRSSRMLAAERTAAKAATAAALKVAVWLVMPPRGVTIRSLVALIPDGGGGRGIGREAGAARAATPRHARPPRQPLVVGPPVMESDWGL